MKQLQNNFTTMREIKFRGKTVPDGRWVYGYYVVMENETKTVTRHAIMDLLDKENKYIKDGKSYHMSVSVVEAETVGQFTGLHDKNGKEIYEGDIFHIGDPNLLHEVVWHDTGFIGKQIGCYGSYVGLEHWADRIEVIGNIHDNNNC